MSAEPAMTLQGADTPANSQATKILLAPIARLLLTPAEAAAALRISARLLWSLTKAEEIPCVRLSRCVRYAPSALASFIEKKLADENRT